MSNTTLFPQKIAIVHDTLAEFGGAERVLQTLLKMFPHAHVFTAFTKPSLIATHFPGLNRPQIHPSWTNHTPISQHIPFFQAISPLVWNRFDLENFDLVISSSSHLLSNLIFPKRPTHIQFIHSLPKNIFRLTPLTPLQTIFPFHKYVVPLYKKSLLWSHHIIANSHHTQSTIHKALGISSTVIYPPVNIPPLPPTKRRPKYFLSLSRIDADKKIEIAIQACNLLSLPLKIAGLPNYPQYFEYLRSISGPTIEFLGFVPDAEIPQLMQSASALIFCAKNEDFGIAPVEAMSYGVPVISFSGGGVKETVIRDKTGLFFHDSTHTSLVETIKSFRPSLFNPQFLYRQSQKFSESVFITKMADYVRHATQLKGELS